MTPAEFVAAIRDLCDRPDEVLGTGQDALFVSSVQALLERVAPERPVALDRDTARALLRRRGTWRVEETLDDLAACVGPVGGGGSDAAGTCHREYVRAYKAPSEGGPLVTNEALWRIYDRYTIPSDVQEERGLSFDSFVQEVTAAFGEGVLLTRDEAALMIDALGAVWRRDDPEWQQRRDALAARLEREAGA